MIYVLRTLIALLLTVIGYHAVLALLIFTVGDIDAIYLYALAIMVPALLIFVIIQLVKVNAKLRKVVLK